MNAPQLVHRTLPLAAGALVALRVPRGTRLGVGRGKAWITVEGDFRDHIVPAGRAITCDDDSALVIVEMLAAGDVTIERPCPPAPDAQAFGPLFNRLRESLHPAPGAAG